MKNALVFLALLSACGGGHNDDDLGDASVGDMALELADLQPMYDAAPAPIVAPANQWTWVPIEGTTCNEGTETGIAVNPGTQLDKLIVFFDGGGACGDYSSCLVEKTASSGPYGATEFANSQNMLVGSYLDRSLAGNPFADWTMVFVPYCTGDLHGGIETVDYTLGSMSATYRHMGHINVLRDYDRVQATWPTLSTLVISGSSAGGYGALINYPDARLRWPTAKGYLIDDSGPPLERNVTSPLLTDWIGEWGLLKWALGECPACSSDVSELVPSIANKFPNDRFSLLESLEDEVIRTFYFLQPADFTTALEALANDRIVPLANFKSFFISGSSHTMLYGPASFSSGATSLETFVEQEVTDDPAWASHNP